MTITSDPKGKTYQRSIEGNEYQFTDRGDRGTVDSKDLVTVGSKQYSIEQILKGEVKLFDGPSPQDRIQKLVGSLNNVKGVARFGLIAGEYPGLPKITPTDKLKSGNYYISAERTLPSGQEIQIAQPKEHRGHLRPEHYIIIKSTDGNDQTMTYVDFTSTELFTQLGESYDERFSKFVEALNGNPALGKFSFSPSVRNGEFAKQESLPSSEPKREPALEEAPEPEERPLSTAPEQEEPAIADGADEDAPEILAAAPNVTLEAPEEVDGGARFQLPGQNAMGLDPVELGAALDESADRIAPAMESVETDIINGFGPGHAHEVKGYRSVREGVRMLDEALAAAQKNAPNKPIAVIMGASSCHNCKELKEKLVGQGMQVVYIEEGRNLENLQWNLFMNPSHFDPTLDRSAVPMSFILQPQEGKKITAKYVNKKAYEYGHEGDEHYATRGLVNFKGIKQEKPEVVIGGSKESMTRLLQLASHDPESQIIS